MDDVLGTRLRLASHPLLAPPLAAPWNLEELDGLLSPGEPRAAAVLVGIIARADAPVVLLTRRHDGLRHHAGQVSFRVAASSRYPAPPRLALREATK